MATLIEDAFTDTNGVLLEDHVMTGTPAVVWEELGSPISPSVPMHIQSNQATTNGVTIFQVYRADAGVADVVQSCDITLPSGSNYLGWLSVRVTDQGNWFAVAVQRDAGGTPYFALYEFIGGTIPLRDSMNFSTDPTNTTVGVTVTTSGTSISALASTGETVAYTSSNNLTTTYFGVLGYEDLAYGRCSYDNFLVEGAGGGGGNQPMMRRWGGSFASGMGGQGIGQSSGGGKAWGRSRNGLYVPRRLAA